MYLESSERSTAEYLYSLRPGSFSCRTYIATGWYERALDRLFSWMNWSYCRKAGQVEECLGNQRSAQITRGREKKFGKEGDRTQLRGGLNLTGCGGFFAVRDPHAVVLSPKFWQGRLQRHRYESTEYAIISGNWQDGTDVTGVGMPAAAPSRG